MDFFPLIEYNRFNHKKTPKGGFTMRKLTKPTLDRLPAYLQYLHLMQSKGESNVSALSVSVALSIGEEVVRKDFQSISSVSGKPRVGYSIPTLIKDIQENLGYSKIDPAVLVGVGQLGKALLGYNDFVNYGVEIILGFDTNPELVGTTIANKTIFAFDQMPMLLRNLSVKMGILTVPAEKAQCAADMMIKSGIKAI